MKEKLEKLIFLITIIILSIVMIFFIEKKEGFHEDEIFSYGSSNYNLDNVFQRYGEKDALNKMIFDEILQGNISQIISKISGYIKDPSKYNQKMEELKKQEIPKWKTKEEAKEYVSIQKQDIINYASVYYNQARDVHPPLFYIIVHLASSIAYGTFSKHIIFTINLIFFILTCIQIRKILNLLDKKTITIQAIILYGLSIGAISTVIFLRMYQMLVFFVLTSLKIHIEIIQQDFEINKNNRNKLIITTILGFLTQYYFCIFAACEFIILIIWQLKKKKCKNLKKYIQYHIISAIIGIAIFPVSIYHIFFSYRGVGQATLNANLITRMITYFKEISYSLSIPPIILLITICVITLITIYLYIKKEKNKEIMTILTLPVILYFLIVCKISPEMSETAIIRYVSIIIPIISIIITIAANEILSKLIKNKYIVTTIISTLILIISINGLTKSKPRYMYEGYNKIKEIAKENQNLNFVYIVDNNFTYMNAMPEFLTYEKSLIINYNEDDLEILKDNEELKDEFILSIRKWMNNEEILKQVMEKSGYSKSQLLIDSNENETIIYKITR